MATSKELERLRQGPVTPAEQIWFDRFSHERLQRWREVMDPVADQCLSAIKSTKPAAMLRQVEQRAASEGGAFQAFLDHSHQVPGWVDFELMEPARRFYRRHGTLQALVLMCSSLVEGYAHSKPAQVLVATGRLRHDVARRIYETGQMLHDITGPEGLRPGGVGHRSLMEVRLLHAAIRKQLLEAGAWDTGRYDWPINQEDMAGTVLEFDFMVVRGLKRLGVHISREEHESMQYFWRYAGYLLGVNEALLPATIEEQEVLALQLTAHLYDPSPDSEALAQALLAGMANRPPFFFSEEVLTAFSRFLIGDEVAADLNLEATMSAATAVRAIQLAVATANMGIRALPDWAKKALEDTHYRMGSRALHQGRHSRRTSKAPA